MIGNYFTMMSPAAYSTPMLPTTEEAEYRDMVNRQKAITEGNTNPWIKGMNIVGTTLQQIGSMAASAYGPAAKAAAAGTGAKAAMAQRGLQGINIVQGLGGLASNLSNSFALGYNGNAPSPGFAEGGELAEYPDGSYQDIQGPSHEQGGTPIDPSQLLNIYSNRVKIDGLSIADRQRKRVQKNVTLGKLATRNPYDTTLIKSWERNSLNNEKLKQQELELQKYIQQLIQQ